MKDYIDSLFQFIDNSPTCYQVIDQIGQRLMQVGYEKLSEKELWKIEAGGCYYVTRNDSSLIAFSIPKITGAEAKSSASMTLSQCRGFHIVAAHSDSPCFKLKENPELTMENHYLKWNVEKYGGMILSTWLDRPLSVAGRVVVQDKGELITKLVNIEKDIAVIPNVAIHMNRDMNKGMEYNPQTDMSPLVGSIEQKNGYLALLAQEAGVEEEDILGQDIFLYNRDQCKRTGIEGEWICGPRLDDLECVYGALEAMVQNSDCDGQYINMLAVFDNEEVGSGTKQGADSTFLRDVLARIQNGLGIEEETYRCMLADSFLISADNAHALHPNHPEKADPENKPYLNEGIVIKYHGSQRYATDAYSAAVMKDICRKAGVPYQSYANRSDIAGGSTLGNILMAQVSMNTVDIGLPQLAMHSACEMAGAKDVAYLIQALNQFYGSDNR
ncbi:MAG: M18 family aminopeptidase [Lachnospiraceae bacterium]